MKRVPLKSQRAAPPPIVVKIDPKELRSSIVLPRVSYQIQATVEQETVFDGMVLPIPRVLIYFLSHTELMIVSLILEKSIEEGDCDLTCQEIGKRLKIAPTTVSQTLYCLRKSGLLIEAPNGLKGGGRVRSLNYEAIQHLNDISEGEDPRVYVRIKKATRKTNILKITKEDIKNAYDHQVVDPDADPAESEEYD